MSSDIRTYRGSSNWAVGGLRESGLPSEGICNESYCVSCWPDWTSPSQLPGIGTEQLPVTLGLETGVFTRSERVMLTRLLANELVVARGECDSVAMGLASRNHSPIPLRRARFDQVKWNLEDAQVTNASSSDPEGTASFCGGGRWQKAAECGAAELCEMPPKRLDWVHRRGVKHGDQQQVPTGIRCHQHAASASASRVVSRVSDSPSSSRRSAVVRREVWLGWEDELERRGGDQRLG